MNRWLHLVIIISVVVVLSSITSRSITASLGIETAPSGYTVIGESEGRTPVYMAGSSLAGDGLSWPRIARELNLTVEAWGVAGSSPSEWENFQRLITGPKLTILVISPYDMNEYLLSDFRAEVVPMGQTIKDLSQTDAEWAFWKRVLSMYPQKYLRMLFPSIGRSFGVIGGLHEKFQSYAKTFIKLEAESNPTLSFDQTTFPLEYKTETINEWSPSKMIRRLASMQSACQGVHAYSGPKKLAFFRMLQQAESNTIVVVVPVSPAYSTKFLTSEVQREFERLIAETQRNFPQVQWIRLDQLNQLNSNEYFWDLVHMNVSGQKIATSTFVHQFLQLAERE
jgi:hypothetical protein